MNGGVLTSTNAGNSLPTGLDYQLFSELAHRFMTPLSTIEALAFNVRRQMEKPSSRPQAAEGLNKISASAQQLRGVVDNMLDFTRLQSQEWPPVKDWHLLEDLLGVVLQQFPQEQSSRVRVNLGDRECTLRVDGGQMAKALWQILDNALRYSPASESVTVTSICERAYDEGPQRARVLLRICDQGPGILEGDEQQIFQPFYRRRITGKGKPLPMGSGLGLAICRHIIYGHDGQIWVDSPPGGGARMNVLLRVARQKKGDDHGND